MGLGYDESGGRGVGPNGIAKVASFASDAIYASGSKAPAAHAQLDPQLHPVPLNQPCVILSTCRGYLAGHMC
jgi:hypothetical protein